MVIAVYLMLIKKNQPTPIESVNLFRELTQLRTCRMS